jgi:hypothetical protein
MKQYELYYFSPQVIFAFLVSVASAGIIGAPAGILGAPAIATYAAGPALLRTAPILTAPAVAPASLAVAAPLSPLTLGAPLAYGARAIIH